MLTDEVLEKVIERLTQRINQGNEYVINEIGKSIGELRTITPSKAHQLVQTLKYGGNYEKIVRQLAKITKLNVQDIYKIFEEVAKNDYQFAQQFYKYRNVKYIPYEENTTLKNMVNSIAKITADSYINLSRTNVMGYAIKNKAGELIFRDIKKVYYELIDEAVLNVGTGKETFDSAMYRKLKEIGESGLKVVYPTTYIGKDGKEHYYTRRLDSALAMNMRDGLRQLHNETQQQFGKEFGANLIEVSHHENPAPDHIDTVDGKQFAQINALKKQIRDGVEKNIKLSDIEGNRVKVNGKWYEDFNYVNDNLKRPVGTLNCYHYTFMGILGITKPEYTEEQLEKSKKKNLDGFYYEDKHYTLYEGQQLLRKIELELRKAKDEQIIGKASNNARCVADAQTRITILNHKYKEVLKVSGFPSMLERARVVNYKRVNINKLKKM